MVSDGRITRGRRRVWALSDTCRACRIVGWWQAPWNNMKLRRTGHGTDRLAHGGARLAAERPDLRTGCLASTHRRSVSEAPVMDGRKQHSPRPRGRPKEDRSDFGRGVSTMPAIWTVAAELEAEWRANGKWKHGSLGDLARHLSATPQGGKAPSTITKMRRDPRYSAHVERKRLALLRLVAGEAPIQSEVCKRIRATIAATYDAIKKRP